MSGKLNMDSLQNCLWPTACRVQGQQNSNDYWHFCLWFMCQDLIRHYTFSHGTDVTPNWKLHKVWAAFSPFHLCEQTGNINLLFSQRPHHKKCWKGSHKCCLLSIVRPKLPTVADACNDDTTFGMFVSHWTLLDTVLVLPKSENWKIPCHATMMLPGTYWAFVESILYSSWNLDAAHVDTGNHRLGEDESRKGKKKTGKKQEKFATQDASANVFLPPHSVHLELECSHFPMLKGRAEDTLCSKKVQRFRWW